MAEKTTQKAALSLIFAGTTEYVAEVRTLAEIIGEKSCKLTAEASNRHTFDKAAVTAVSNAVTFRSRCAKIEATIDAFGGKDAKDYKRFARKEYAVAKEALAPAIADFNTSATDKSLKRMQLAEQGLKDALYGAGFVNRTLKAVLAEEDLPVVGEGQAVGEHWLHIAEIASKTKANQVAVILETIATEAKALVASDEWTPFDTALLPAKPATDSTKKVVKKAPAKNEALQAARKAVK